MYDLRVGSEIEPEIAIECIGAVDRHRTETWNVGPAKGSFDACAPGDWHIVLRPRANVQRIRAAIPALLGSCVDAEISGHTPVDAFLQIQNPVLYERLNQLKIAAIDRYMKDRPGRVYLGMTGYGGAVDPTGQAVPGWIGEFLHAEERQDVLTKLRAAGAIECHVFVIVSFGGVPWPVESYLGTYTELVPQEPPNLPEPVRSVWVMYGRKGLRWDGSVWRFFDALVPASDRCLTSAVKLTGDRLTREAAATRSGS
jgi:hypothetical protein